MLKFNEFQLSLQLINFQFKQRIELIMRNWNELNLHWIINAASTVATEFVQSRRPWCKSRLNCRNKKYLENSNDSDELRMKQKRMCINLLAQVCYEQSPHFSVALIRSCQTPNQVLTASAHYRWVLPGLWYNQSNDIWFICAHDQNVHIHYEYNVHINTLCILLYNFVHTNTVCNLVISSFNFSGSVG